MIRRLLIANRGEIAVRIARTCKRLGVETVAIYSDADAEAPHVMAATSAVHIGPAAPAESYLHIGRVLAAARASGADAVHPGYGFLSENPAFARDCEAAGLVFVGPPASIIETMGSKIAARATMTAAGIPVVPGASVSSQDAPALVQALQQIGYPAVIKASAGGGGIGMRVVRTAGEADEAIRTARSEAARAFGDDTLYVERLIAGARHVEVQVLADTHGHVVHLGERDCSLQRRYQKVIEEAPAPRLSPALRSRLTAAAVRAATAVGYVNAGTIEFLVDGEDDDAAIYFLEMNTRLQVEHPVTEAITGLDLVEAQLRIAAGERLPVTQDDVSLTGHAIECRLYAEDPERLLPQAGRLVRYREPSGPGVRVDSGVMEGSIVTVHYNPLLAKLVVHAETREAARERMIGALGRFEILGLRHNGGWLRRLLRHPRVVSADVHTGFIEEHAAELIESATETRLAAAAIAAVLSAPRDGREVQSQRDGTRTSSDPWTTLGRVSW
jgi:acetyl-CoA carboxylase biotin carboxylase subunit